MFVISKERRNSLKMLRVVISEKSHTVKRAQIEDDETEEIYELARRMSSRIEKHQTVEGFNDDEVKKVLKKVKCILEELPAMIELRSPVVVVGDLHGQLLDMMKYIESIGRPPEFQYLFLGDYVDRGDHSFEVILWLFCNKILHPDHMHLLRGNHEVRRINQLYGFNEEMSRKRTKPIWKLVNDVFCELPLCANINRKILCMHGGISIEIQSWDSLYRLEKPRKHSKCDSGLILDLMWADPNRNNDESCFNTSRGISNIFGESTVNEICNKLKIDLIVRAHELQNKGHEFLFDNRLLTIFSAPYYSGKYSNSGSVAKISRTLKLQVMTLKPRRALKTLRMERDALKVSMNLFDPTAPNSFSKCPPCREHLNDSHSSQETGEIFEVKRGKMLGADVMYGHETKNCKQFRTSAEKAEKNNEGFSLQALNLKLNEASESKKGSKESDLPIAPQSTSPSTSSSSTPEAKKGSKESDLPIAPPSASPSTSNCSTPEAKKGSKESDLPSSQPSTTPSTSSSKTLEF